MKKIIIGIIFFISAYALIYTGQNIEIIKKTPLTGDTTTPWIYVQPEQGMPQAKFIIEGVWGTASGSAIDGTISIYGTIGENEFTAFSSTYTGVLLETVAIDSVDGNFGIQFENMGWRAIKCMIELNTLDSLGIFINSNMSEGF